MADYDEMIRSLERFQERTARSVRPPGGVSRAPGRPTNIDEVLGDILIPKTPLDVAATFALGPGGRAGAKIAGLTLGAILSGDEAQAGPISRVTRYVADAARGGGSAVPGRASPQEISRLAAESYLMSQPKLRKAYTDLGLIGGPPSEVVRPTLAAQQPAEEVARATALKLEDRAALDRLSPTDRKLFQQGKPVEGFMLPSQETARPALEAFDPIKKQVTKAEKMYDAAVAAGRAPPPIFNLDPAFLRQVPNVDQFPLPRIAPQITERLRPAFEGTAGVDRVKAAAAKADPQDWGWYNIQEPLATFTQAHGSVKGPQAADAWVSGLAGTSMVNPIDNNVRGSSYYLGKILRGEPLPQVVSVPDPVTGKTVQTLAGAPPPGYGAKSQVQHASRVRQYIENTADPVSNPKPFSYREGLRGNWVPRTVDTHDIRNIVGMPYALKAFNETSGAVKPAEYAAMEILGNVASKDAGVPQAMQQAATWIGGRDYTKLKSRPTPLPEVLNRRAHVTGMVRGVSPFDAWMEHVTGKRELLALPVAALPALGAGQEE